MLSQLNPVHTLTTYFHETQFIIVLSFILCSQYSSWCWVLCEWLRVFLRWNHVALVAEFYLMIFKSVGIWLYCGVSSSLYFKGLYSVHFQGLKISENVWNCMPINKLLHPRRLASQWHWCKNPESLIILDVYAYTACYMEVKPLQKSNNSVHSLGSEDCHLPLFLYFVLLQIDKSVYTSLLYAAGRLILQLLALCIV